MALHEVEGPAGAPWERPIHGTLDRLVVESDLLAGNPLGDPSRRPLYVYRPPGVEPHHPRRLPSVYVIMGYTGQLDMWLTRTPFEPTMVERLDAMFVAGDCPDAIVVFVDAWTSYGGSQYLNSSSLGRYQDYLCDEVPAFVDDRYPTLADRDHRGLTGKSSGGYGAMIVPMVRPEMYGDAAAYSPDPANPGKALLPFEVATGRLIDDVWAQWLEHDPVRMAPAHADALRSMRRIYLDAGRTDEYYLDLGAQAFATELATLGVDHSLELFEGK